LQPVVGLTPVKAMKARVGVHVENEITPAKIATLSGASRALARGDIISAGQAPSRS
jgi:hypothetical protein